MIPSLKKMRIIIIILNDQRFELTKKRTTILPLLPSPSKTTFKLMKIQKKTTTHHHLLIIIVSIIIFIL